MADIFLSYKREDRQRARRVERAFEDQGFSVFWDPELLPGIDYRQELQQELDAARCVVVLWSRLSVDAGFVIDEAEQGRRRGHLVSVKIDDVEVPLGFGQIQAANLVEWNGDPADPAFQLLVRGVTRHVSQELPRPEPSPVPLPLPPVPLLTPRPAPGRRLAVRAAAKPTLLLALVFLVNYLETTVDKWLTPSSLGAEAGYPITDAFRWFERGLSFESHDATGVIASHGYTLSYFLALPLICLFVAWNLARRRDPRPYQALGLAVAIDYLVSLPFFIFFPVPERWTVPESEAMLLSDKVSDRLIELIRPISGLDNSFPSFHVSLSVLVATACFLFAVPLRRSILALAATIVLATFVLGVHWLPDMLAGLALGLGSMLLAWRLTVAGVPEPALNGS